MNAAVASSSSALRRSWAPRSEDAATARSVAMAPAMAAAGRVEVARRPPGAGALLGGPGSEEDGDLLGHLGVGDGGRGLVGGDEVHQQRVGHLVLLDGVADGT